MFNHLKIGKTFIFIDLSNIFYTQYAMGWQFNIEKFFQKISTDSGITKTLLFGAYSDNVPSQKKWVDTLKETYDSKDNFHIYFKTTRFK